MAIMASTQELTRSFTCRRCGSEFATIAERADHSRESHPEHAITIAGDWSGFVERIRPELEKTKEAIEHFDAESSAAGTSFDEAAEVIAEHHPELADRPMIDLADALLNALRIAASEGHHGSAAVHVAARRLTAEEAYVEKLVVAVEARTDIRAKHAAPRRRRRAGVGTAGRRSSSSSSDDGPEPDPPLALCAGCGNPFTPSRPNNLYHPECYEAAKTERRAQKRALDALLNSADEELERNLKPTPSQRVEIAVIRSDPSRLARMLEEKCDEIARRGETPPAEVLAALPALRRVAA